MYELAKVSASRIGEFCALLYSFSRKPRKAKKEYILGMETFRISERQENPGVAKSGISLQRF